MTFGVSWRRTMAEASAECPAACARDASVQRQSSVLDRPPDQPQSLDAPGVQFPSPDSQWTLKKSERHSPDKSKPPKISLEATEPAGRLTPPCGYALEGDDGTPPDLEETETR